VEHGDMTGDPNRSGPATLPPAPLDMDTLTARRDRTDRLGVRRFGPPPVRPIGRTGTDRGVASPHDRSYPGIMARSCSERTIQSARPEETHG
jgi:hypothetical protein